MDVIANMITIIRNGYLARKAFVSVPYSRLSKEVADKIRQAGFLEDVVFDQKENRLKITLGYKDSEPLLHGIKRISRPSLPIYASTKKIPKVLGGLGEVIVSTPKGVLTGTEAKKAKVGGELLVKVW